MSYLCGLLIQTVMADIILGIESSCDDTSAAVIRDGYLLSNVIASQDVHRAYGGVVPELASRAHELNIVPVVSEALSRASVSASQLTAIAFTRGPGLLGSLLVGTSFAKAMGLALDIPIVMVNHLQGHILANFIRQPDKPVREPSFHMLKFVPHRLLLRLKWMPPARVGVVGGVVEATGFAHVDEEGCGAPDAHGAVVLLVGEDDFVALGVAPAAEGGARRARCRRG